MINSNLKNYRFRFSPRGGKSRTCGDGKIKTGDVRHSPARPKKRKIPPLCARVKENASHRVSV
jgi:hypothetical protein